MNNSATLAKQYQRKTDKQHILDNPDTYIGSVENIPAKPKKTTVEILKNNWLYS